jgi:hypothetical protein
MKRTLEQLRSQIWGSRDEATKDLKRNGFAPRGADYELRASSSGSWQIMPIDADAADDAPPPAKKGERSRADRPAINHETIRPDVFTPPQDTSPQKPQRKPKKAAAVAPAGGESTRRDGQTIPEPTPEVVVPEDLPERLDSLASLPTDGGPYTLAVGAEAIRQNGAVAQALDISRAIKLPVSVIGPSGTVLRTVDAQAIRAAGRRPAASRVSGPVKSTGKSAEAAAMLLRPQGATMDQLRAVTEWSFGERYIRRLAATHKATIETVAPKHWRLIKS